MNKKLYVFKKICILYYVTRRCAEQCYLLNGYNKYKDYYNKHKEIKYE